MSWRGVKEMRMRMKQKEEEERVVVVPAAVVVAAVNSWLQTGGRGRWEERGKRMKKRNGA